MAAKGSGNLPAAASWMVAILVAAGAMAGARGDFASDQAECTEQLTALLPCLAFVEGTAPAPTPDCCGDSKVVVGRSLKCLCVLVKDRNEPGLGFKINITRAITLPALCNVPANMSDCPKLLKLPSGSPEEKEFYEFEEQILQTIRGCEPRTRRMGSLWRTGSLRCEAAAALVVVAMVAAMARGDTGKERDECAERLVGMSPCLTYVEGGAGAAPTPDCCSGLKSAIGNNPKCLCVLVRDRDDPNLGFHINLTRALSLPTACSAPVNISRCPELLNLAPNSPDAQIFKNLPAASTGKANSSSASDRGTGGGTGVHPSSGGGQLSYVYHPLVVGGRWWVGVEHSFVDGLLHFILMACFALMFW